MTAAPALPTRPVARTGVEVTTLGFGAASLGNLYRAVDDEQAQRAVDAAWDCGVRYFDTAPHYGLGLSERRLGAALAGRPRSEYTVSTKVGRLLEPNPASTGSDMANLFDTPDTHVRVKDYSAAGVRRSIEDSLERLGLDRIDIALVHDPDLPQEQHDTLTQALPELARLRYEGLIGAVGVGMNEWQAPLRFVTESEPGTVDVVMLAGRWTLLDRTGAPLLEACLARGVSVLAAAPFNSGLLARPRPDAGSHFDYVAPSDEVLRAATELAEAAEAAGASLPQAAIQFPLRHPAVASVVTGIARPEHARTSTDWLSRPVATEFWPRADRITEGIL